MKLWPFARRPQAAAPARGQRQYAAAKIGRLLFPAPTSSANQELYTSLAALRDRSRLLCRDNAYARRAKTLVVNNTIGHGIEIQGQVQNQRGRLLDPVNTGIETAWDDWCCAETCHTGGALHFYDLERAAMGEVFEAGECFIRLHLRPFGHGQIPLALELIESERIAADHEIAPPPGAEVTLGIEHDAFGRMLAVYVHRYHPRELRLIQTARDEILRIPADQILHLRSVERWPQVRGVPRLHAVIGRLHQLDEFELAALVAARIGASSVGFFEDPNGDPSQLADPDDDGAAGTPQQTVEPGQFMTLPPGYKFTGWDPSYPHQAFEPFVRDAKRAIAAGCGPNYESLSRDYSQSNYSSSRLAALDDRDLWRIDQRWWLRAFRTPLHRRWLQAAVLAGAIPAIGREDYLLRPAKYEAVKFKLRGWNWVDPTKEVTAFKEAEKAGYTTKTDIIAATGGGMDIEDVIATRERELAMLADKGLASDTVLTPGEPVPDSPPPAPASDPADDQPAGRVVPLRGLRP